MSDPLSMIGGAVIVAALALNFFLSLSESALVAVSDITLRRLSERGDRRAALAREMRASNDYLSVIIVGINLTVIVISTVMTVLLHHRSPEGAALEEELWQVGMIALILIVCELTPKTWGAVMSERLAVVVAPGVHVMVRVCLPFVRFTTAISNVLLRSSGPAVAHGRYSITSEEIQAAADISEEEGLVEPEEGEMLDSVMELGETSARRVMVPRVELVAIPVTASAETIVRTIVESGHSRIPVYEDTIDSIIGVLYANDLLAAFRAGQSEVDVRELCREPLFVPEYKRIHELFRELQDRSVHIAIVVDEFGGTEGIVTIEDILEELVGEIEDEHDAPAEEIVVVSEHEAVADARCSLDEIRDVLALDLPEDGYETIGGFVAGEMGYIPQSGEVLDRGAIRIIVEQSTTQHIERVRIIRTRAAEGSER